MMFVEFVATILASVLEPEQAAQLIAAAYPRPFDPAYFAYVVTQEVAAWYGHRTMKDSAEHQKLQEQQEKRAP